MTLKEDRLARLDKCLANIAAKRHDFQDPSSIYKALDKYLDHRFRIGRS